jgi:KUP system potassium uptake protein
MDPAVDSQSAEASGRYLAALCLTALGIVYGDIGTSPLYAFRECFNPERGLGLTHDNVLGVLSLIFWALALVISIKYLSYVMRADNKGEGGILALMALATRRGRRAGWVLVLGLFGAALLYGDGMITPAISVLGAVEGLEVAAPSLEQYVVPATIVILIGLFLVQKRGTASVGAVFGPVTLVWFAVISVLGISQIIGNPAVLLAVSPTYGLSFLTANGMAGFLVLGSVFLVVTGGEALYADMGHLGARPIRLTWFALVLPALLLNYFGQGALLLANPEAASSPFYRMAPEWSLYPLLILSTMATIIASQAVISGAFSLTRQATMLGFWPRVRIEHTSAQEIGQIYVPSVNWALMVATIGLVIGFGSSSNLAAAYGIAVTTTMVITTLLAWVVARHRWNWSPAAALALTAFFLVIDTAFFGANIVKVAQGGWFPLLAAGLIFLLMTTWQAGRSLLARRVAALIVPIDEFFREMEFRKATRVPGAAVYMTSNPTGTPPALMQNLLHQHAVHEQVVLLTIVTEETPRVGGNQRVEVEDLGHGFVRIRAHYGFMEDPDVVKLLARADTPSPPIAETTFFLGRETVVAGGRGMSRWRARLFGRIVRNSTQATAFFNVPPNSVVEVGSQIEI